MAVKAGCDLNCGSTYQHLDKAVNLGLISEEEIDQSLKRLFLARIKLGLLNQPNEVPFNDIGLEDLESQNNQRVALQTARESLVLLKNDQGVLPLAKSLNKITVVGPTANDRHFAMGNYFGTPSNKSTILQGIRAKVAGKTKVEYFKGTDLTRSDSIYDVVDLTYFKGKVKVEYYDNAKMEGEPVREAEEKFIDFEWGGAAPIDLLTPGDFSIKYTGVIQPDFSGELLLGMLESGGSYKLYIDGKLWLEGSSGNGTRALSKPIQFEKNKKVKFVLEYHCTNPWIASLQLVWNKESQEGESILLQNAKNSDVIIYVGGITARLEGEEMPVQIDGFHKGDRTNLQLPKAQKSLLQKLYNTGRPVVFVLTTGSAMAINWSQEHLAAIVNAWYPGQAGGEAVADVLFGDYNPSGKLPVTFYRSVNDLPPFEDYHMKGRTYKYFNGKVLYPFGYGLSYAEFEFGTPQLSQSVIGLNDKVTVSVNLKNNSSVNGTTVVQLYVKDIQASVTKPLKALKRFKKVSLEKNSSHTISFELSTDDLSIIDDYGHPLLEKGQFEILIGPDSSTRNAAVLTLK